MYYYAYINESSLVDYVCTSETQITEENYVEITEEQYNLPIVPYLYHPETNTFEEWGWTCSSSDVSYPGTNIMITTVIDNMSDEIDTKANLSVSIVTALTATGWTEDGEAHKQTLIINGITPTINGVVGIAQTATDEQRQQAASAMLHVTEQGTNQLTIKALGEVPTVNIPLEIILL